MNTWLSPKRLQWFVVIIFSLVVLGLYSPAAATGRQQQEQPTPTPIDTPVAEEGVPVVVNGRELFRVETRIGSITATERAALISEHIGRLANNPFSGDVTIEVLDIQGATDIVADGEVLVSVTDGDATAAGRGREELAQEWAASIQTFLTEIQAGQDVQALVTGLIIALSILLTLVCLIWLINRFSNWLIDKLDPATESGRRPPILTQSEFYQSGLFSRILRLLLRTFKVALVIFLIAYAIPVILRLFPQTRIIGNRLGELLLDPLAKLWDSFVGFLPDLFFLVVLGFLTWLAIWLVRLFFREVERGVIRLPSFLPEWANFTGRMVSFLLIIVAVIVGFTSLPISELPIFQGISAFLALLLTLASSSAIANIIAGVILTYTGAFQLGDIVEIQAMRGEVTGKYLLTTRLRTFKNELVSVPNSLVLSSSVTNFSRLARENGLTLHTTVTIGYDVPWQKVHELLIAAAVDSEDILKSPKPFVLQTSLNDYHVSYELNAYTRKPEILPRLYSRLHQNIQTRFNSAGVEIMSPAFAALRDGNTIALPPEFLPDNYRPSAFRAQAINDGQPSSDV